MFELSKLCTRQSYRPHALRAAKKLTQRAVASTPITMSSAEKQIKNVLLVIAMQAEAEPIVEALGLAKDAESVYASPWRACLNEPIHPPVASRPECDAQCSLLMQVPGSYDCTDVQWRCG